jgi:hypothetical protein
VLRFRYSRQFLTLLAGMMCLFLWGCRASVVNNAQAPIKTNMQALGRFYGSFTGQNRGRPPKNEQEFKDYLKKQPPETLALMKVDSVDALFVSPRDNQPLVFHFDVPPAFPGAPDAVAFAHEQTGVDGKRFVLLTSGDIQEMDETQFGQVSAKK